MDGEGQSGDVSDGTGPWDTGDVGTDSDATDDADTSDTTADAEPTDDVDSSDSGPDPNRPLLGDYLPCEEDIDCPVGFGTCLRSLTLNRTDREGVSTISVADLPGAEGRTGVCSVVCTNDPSVCDALTRTGPDGRSESWSCQLVAQGASPYTTDFDDPGGGVDLDEMRRGRPFAAICRPPLYPHHRSDRFCRPCDEEHTCAEGTCWDPLLDEVDQEEGFCLTPCNDGQCPFGFTCTEHDGSGWCQPVLGTCSACRDLDGNGFGTGLCAGDDGVSPYDCNDLEPRAFFDPGDLDHPFPDLCTGADFNCNGIADDLELIGNTSFASTDDAGANIVPHCTACDDPCGGRVPNGAFGCVPLDDTFSCRVVCDPGTDEAGPWHNCDGNPATGCEIDFSEAGVSDRALRNAWRHGDPIPTTELLYADCDGDGFGDPDRPLLLCPDDGDEIPEPECENPAPGAGWVANNLDCDDTDPDIHPDAPERCDGRDSNCDGIIDNPAALDEPSLGTDCDTGLTGACAAGTIACLGHDGLGCQHDAGDPGGLLCAGYDPGCDPDEDRSTDELRALLDTPCEAEHVESVCREGAYACDVQRGFHCRAGAANPDSRPDLDTFVDDSCDGFDGNLARAVFVNPFAPGSGVGTREQPMADLAEAYQTAIDRGADVYLSTGVHVLDAPLQLHDGVSIYGGYNPSSWVRDRSTSGSTIERRNPPVDRWLIALEGENLTNRTELQWLTVSTEAPNRPGVSVAALACINCPGLQLRGVSLNAASGTAGSSGSGFSEEARAVPGNPGLDADSSPVPAPECPTVGLPAFPGAGGGGGLLDEGTRGQNASPAGTATGGAAGTATSPSGAPGQGGVAHGHGPLATHRLTRTGWIPTASDGRTRMGNAGSGGGGGFSRFAAGTLLGGGSGGSGACGGRGGDGGQGGGSSFGLVLAQSGTVLVERVSITAGSGGAGGDGGRGEGGGHASPGGNGSVASGQRAGDGGQGGAGAGGDGGGGGGGGWSFAVFRDRNSGLGTVGTPPTLGFGAPGGGGSGGAPGIGGSRASSSDPIGLNGANGQPGNEGPDGFAGNINETGAGSPTNWEQADPCHGPGVTACGDTCHAVAGAAPCYTSDDGPAGTGTCTLGSWTCMDDHLTCDQQGQFEGRICDGRDGNCSGVVDQGCPGTVNRGNVVDRHQLVGNTTDNIGGFTAVDCDEGQVMIGVRGVVTTRGNVPWFSRISPRCRALAVVADTDTIPYRHTAAPTGPVAIPGTIGQGSTGPLTTTDLDCPDGQVAIGAVVRAGGHVEGIRLRCATFAIVGELDEWAVEHRDLWESDWLGRSNAHDFQTVNCDPGRALAGLRGHYGNNHFRFDVNSLGVRCAPIGVTPR